MSLSWKDLEEDVVMMAPALGAMVGGPAGAAAGKLIATALGCDHSPDAVAQALKSDPDAAVKLQQLENDKTLGLAQINANIQTAQINAEAAEVQSDTENTSSARDMAKATGLAPQIILSTIFIVGFFWVLGELLHGELSIPAAERDIAILLIGLIVREIPTIMQFWFGSSSSSRDKDKTIQLQATGDS